MDPSILRPRSSQQHFHYERHEAPAPLSELIEHFWTVTWALSPGQSFTAQTLPYPSVNLSVTNTEADVTGLTRRCYYRHLEGLRVRDRRTVPPWVLPAFRGLAGLGSDGLAPTDRGGA